MSSAALDQLIASEEAFVVALDGDDVGALEASLSTLSDAVTRVAASGAWRAEREIAAGLVQALRLAEAAKARIHYLADMNRRRLDKLAQLAGATRPQAYNRAGRFG